MSSNESEMVVEAMPGDLEGLVALEKMFSEDDRISRRSWQRFLRKPGTVLVIREGDAIVASAVVLCRSNSAVSRLYSLSVAPRARGRGLARMLLAAFEVNALKSGMRELSLEVRRSNEAAIALYRSVGFVKTAVIGSYYDDGEDALKMRKTLAGVNSK